MGGKEGGKEGWREGGREKETGGTERRTGRSVQDTQGRGLQEQPDQESEGEMYKVGQVPQKSTSKLQAPREGGKEQREVTDEQELRMLSANQGFLAERLFIYFPAFSMKHSL